MREPRSEVRQIGRDWHELGAGMKDGRVVPNADLERERQRLLIRFEELFESAFRRSPQAALILLEELPVWCGFDKRPFVERIELALTTEKPTPLDLSWAKLLRSPVVSLQDAPAPSSVTAVIDALELELHRTVELLYTVADGFGVATGGDMEGTRPYMSWPSLEDLFVEDDGDPPRRLGGFVLYTGAQLSDTRDASVYVDSKGQCVWVDDGDLDTTARCRTRTASAFELVEHAIAAAQAKTHSTSVWDRFFR